MKIPVIIQVRTGSTRLPGKAALQLGGVPLFERVLLNLQQSRLCGPLVAAMPVNSAEELAPLAKEHGVCVVLGDEADVLGRYAAALKQFPCEHFVRATGDNPFVSAELLDLAVAYHLVQQADLTHFLGIPLGSGVEVVRTAALQEADRFAKLDAEREHVTPWLYANRQQFRVCEPELPLGKDLRLTVDTRQDFERAQRVLTALGDPVTVHLAQLLKLHAEQPVLFE